MSDPTGFSTAPGPLRAASAHDDELEQLLDHYRRTQAQNPAGAGAAVQPPTFLVPPPTTGEPMVAPPVPAYTAAHLDEQPLGFELPGAYSAPTPAQPVTAAEPAPTFAVPEPVALDPAYPDEEISFDDDAVFDAPVSTRYIPDEFDEQLPGWSGPQRVAPVDPAAVYEMGDGPSPWAAYEDVEKHSDVEPELLPEHPPIATIPIDQLPPSFAALISGESLAQPAQPTTFTAQASPEAVVVAAPASAVEPVAQPAVAPIDPFAGLAPEPASVQAAEQVASPIAAEYVATQPQGAPAAYASPEAYPAAAAPQLNQQQVESPPLVPAEAPAAAQAAQQPFPFDQQVLQQGDAVQAPPAVPPSVPQAAFDAASFFDMNAAVPEIHPVPDYTIPGPVTDEPAYVPPNAVPVAVPSTAAAPSEQPYQATYSAPPQPVVAQHPYVPVATLTTRPDGHVPLTAAGGSIDAQHWLDVALRDLTAVGASDVHLAKSGATGDLIVRGRRDGVLEFVHQFHDRDSDTILNLLKTQAHISTGSNRVPDDGRYELPIDGYPYRIRAVSLPLFDGGEQLVLRLPQTGPLKHLEELGFWEPNLQATKSLARLPGGMTIIAGPMGEGKTTTAHAFLAEVGRGDTAITTVEDPVERVLPGVNQIEVNEDIGAGFGDIMRYLVRADFDTLFIGEIRDQATAVAAVRMAKAGRRVVSTIHATDNVTALLRLMELSSDSPLSVLDAVRGVISQRLVRRLGDGPDGYLGRAPIHEVLTVNERLVEEMISGQSIGAIRSAAAETSTTFKQNIAHLLEQGVTDKREAERVIGHV